MKTIVYVGLSLVLYHSTYGQDNPDVMVESFFSNYSTNYKEAFNDAFTTNKYINVEGPEVQDLIQQLEDLVVQLGDYLEFEKIQKVELGSRLYEYVYYVYYDRQPIRFVIEMYKAKESWVFHNISYDLEFN